MNGRAGTARAQTTLAAIDRLATKELDPPQILEEIINRVVDVVGADAFFVGATDPDSHLPLGVGTGYRLDEEPCRFYWKHEMLAPDYNQFTALSPAAPVGDLRQATGGHPARSLRFRRISASAGLGDELRVTLPAGGRRWGDLQLNRRVGSEPFSQEDRAFLSAMAPLGGVALRRACSVAPTADGGANRGPGVLVLDPDARVVSSSPEADEWLTEIKRAWHSHSATPSIDPVLLLLTSLAGLVGRGAPPCRTRLRTPDGTWLLAHASRLGTSGQTVMVISPASGVETAPIILDALGLTAREVDVVRLLAAGLATSEIAASLALSPHTIRDHLKVIFGKAGVSSRGELIARVFTGTMSTPVISEA